MDFSRYYTEYPVANPRNGRFEHGVVASALGLTTPHLGGFFWLCQDRNVSWRACTNNDKIMVFLFPT